MKVVELVKISRELLKLLSKHDVRLNDWRYVRMYEEYKTMRSNGIKYRECVRVLAEENDVSQATVERVVKRLGGEV